MRCTARLVGLWIVFMAFCFIIDEIENDVIILDGLSHRKRSRRDPIELRKHFTSTIEEFADLKRFDFYLNHLAEFSEFEFLNNEFYPFHFDFVHSQTDQRI